MPVITARVIRVRRCSGSVGCCGVRVIGCSLDVWDWGVGWVQQPPLRQRRPDRFEQRAGLADRGTTDHQDQGAARCGFRLA
jgi:hypothetical protein